MRLYSYWRSSAAYRVRIALHWKGLPFETVSKHLGKGEQRGADYLGVNPQGFVPALEAGGDVLGQSLAIVEYLDEIRPSPPLLPPDPIGRARVRSMALSIACDIHPLNNLRVLNYLKGPLAQPQEAVDAWYRHWVTEGFRSLESRALRYGDGAHLYGSSVTLADVCLVPQLYNARRFDVDLAPFPALVAIGQALEALPAFVAARPEVQPDAA
jgi:maleylacetoacetate isomerase/maleylpyruvate isomerase